MRYRKLGPSDLEVSEISLGSWLTFSSGVALEQTRACTDAAFEAGINFLRVRRSSSVPSETKPNLTDHGLMPHSNSDRQATTRRLAD